MTNRTRWNNMTPEQREANREYQRVWAANKYRSDAHDRLREMNRLRQARRRARLTEAEREAHRAYQRAYNVRLRGLVLAYYGGDPPSCACCGEQHYEFLALDHIDGNGAQHRREIAGASGQGGGADLAKWLRNHGYPDGFRVLCHNCNFARGHYGHCPHEKDRVVPIMRGKDAVS